MSQQSQIEAKILLIATKNPGKAREFADLLGGGWDVKTLLDYTDLKEGVEDGVTFQENAQKKALAVSKQVGADVLVLADDSGLEVDALKGEPGVYAARYSGETDPKLRDGANNAKLLHALKDVPETKRGAQFRCVLSLAQNGKIVAETEGISRGRILTELKGKDGFGYDPLFAPNGFDRTYAEMTLAEKHATSHRAQATAKMVAELARLAA